MAKSTDSMDPEPSGISGTNRCRSVNRGGDVVPVVEVPVVEVPVVVVSVVK